MSLTLANFKKQIDAAILQRGREYYRGGHIVDLDEIDEGHWSAQVEGTDTYAVDITQAASGELSCECDCPYDLGPVCKHTAAVLYAIEEAFPEYSESKPKKPRKKRQTTEEKVLDILKKLTHAQLVDLVAEIAQADRQLTNMILARFSDGGSEKKLYSRMVKDALNLGKREYGFIDYWGSSRAAKGVRSVLERADEMLIQGQPAKAIPILQAVIETLVPAMGHADDSNGELGGCIEDALEMLAQALIPLSPHEQAAIFEYIVTEAPHEKYRGWDWGWDLAGIGAGLVTTPEQRTKLFAMLDQMAGERRDQREERRAAIPPSLRADDFFSNFDTEQADFIKMRVIERLDGDAAVEAFLKERVDRYRFRQALVEFYLMHDRLDDAKRLCTEYIRSEGKQYPGIVHSFEAMLMVIAYKQGDNAEVQRLARKLFDDTGRFEYYEMLKQVSPKEAWDAEVERLIAGLDRIHYHEMVAEIYLREEKWDKLLAALKDAHPGTVEHYRKHVETRFPAEMCGIYERIALNTLEQKASRPGYQSACKYLRRIDKLGQKERVTKLVQTLKDKYKNRPALLDELKKVRP